MIELAGALATALGFTCAVLAAGWSGALRPAGPPGALHLRLDHPDLAALDDVGWVAYLRRWEAARAGAVALAAAVGAHAGMPPYLVMPLAAALPSLALRERARVVRERARRGVTAVVGAAHAALASGMPLTESMRRGVEASTDPLARRPFVSALAAFALGASLDEALRDAATRERDDRVRVALETFALGVGERLPTERLAKLAGALAERLAYEDRLDDEVRARAGGARLQVRMLAVVVPGIALYLAATTPGVAAALGSPLGRTVLVPIALSLEVAGFVISRRAVAGVLR